MLPPAFRRPFTALAEATRSVGGGRRCSQLVPLVWAIAEATCSPIMPDAALVPLAATRPAAWWRFALAAAAGSTAGGCLSFGLGRRIPARPLLAHLPLVRPRMVEAADAWLASERERALLRQPHSGVPFKVFALLAGEQRLRLGAFLGWALLARGARFFVVCGLSALAGRRAARLLRRYPLALLVLWSLLFLLGLRRTVQRWA
jgi:membrane protein YqaA with SNARE-associated domain